MLEQLKPLYQELHTYVRKQLRKQYGTELFPVSGQIPAHLLGIYDYINKCDTTLDISRMIIYKGKFVCTYISILVFLGNMWAQQWNNIYDLVIPYKNKAKIDITPVLKEKVGF